MGQKHEDGKQREHLDPRQRGAQPTPYAQDPFTSYSEHTPSTLSRRDTATASVQCRSGEPSGKTLTGI
jgi:hypothetical protein